LYSKIREKSERVPVHKAAVISEWDWMSVRCMPCSWKWNNTPHTPHNNIK
jgi:hypothetical protein